MPDIKVKKKEGGSIKTLDKSKIATQKLKDNIIKAKNITLNSYDNLSESKDEDNVNEYTTNKLNNAIRVTKDKGLDKFNQYGRKGIKETKQNIEITKRKLDLAKKRSHARKVSKGIIKSSEKQIATIKTAERTSKKSVKNSIKTGGKVIKTTENTALAIQENAKLQAKTAQKTAKIIKESAKQAVKVTKDTIKSVIRAIRAIIAATKALIMFLIAGGWIVALIVIVICMIGMLVSSIFGIFFSGENIGDGSKSMTSVISELNQEFIGKITQIQIENPYEEFDINGSRASCT